MASITQETHTVNTKIKMSLSHKGKHTAEKNSQYGTMWITDGFENKKIKKGQDLPFGFSKGRIQHCTPAKNWCTMVI